MTLQNWLQENRYADSTPRRIGVLWIKGGIEFTAVSLPIGVLVVIAEAAFGTIGGDITKVPDEPGLVWILLSLLALKQLWCMISDDEPAH